MDKPLCTHCETKLKITSCGDPELMFNCYVPCRAACPKCGRTYKVLAVYAFANYDELEEET